MREFPEGTQILGSPPPLHPLRDRYTGRIAVLPDNTEVLLDPSLLVPEAQPDVSATESGEAAGGVDA